MYTQVLIFGRSLYMKEYLFFDVATRKLVVREAHSSKFREDMRLFIPLEFSFSKDERNVFKVVENLFLESQEIESRELKIPVSSVKKLVTKLMT